MDRAERPVTPVPGLLLNPRLPEEERLELSALRPLLGDFHDHYWLLSSGSTSARAARIIGLSRPALCASAAAVNAHLESDAFDVWGLALPTFHVGGLGILVRAELAGARAVDLTPILEGRGFAGAARDFALRIFEEGITLLSLVPTQVFDLVDQRIPAPPSLRAVVIGGAALAPDLYLRARALGWPLLPSFGMTECASQIATAEMASLMATTEMESLGATIGMASLGAATGIAPLMATVAAGLPRLRVLSHCEVGTDAESCLWLRSASLLTGIFRRDEAGSWSFHDPKVDGVLRTQDRVELSEGRWLRPLGRVTDFVKVKGEGVDLAALRERFFLDWSAEERARAEIVDLPDERDGARLALVLEGAMAGSALIAQRLQAWNLGAFPPERLETRRIEHLPRTELGKIAWEKLRRALAYSAR